MEDMTPEEFCEFMRLIRDLRFKGIDTKPEQVENKSVRLAWRSVRPVVMKSTQNAKDYRKKQQAKSEAEIEVSTYTAQPTNILPMEEEFDIPQDFNPEFSNYVGEEKEQSIDTNGKEEWLESLREDKYPSRREKFDMGWMNYYANRQDAKEEAETYLAPYKIFVRF